MNVHDLIGTWHNNRNGITEHLRTEDNRLSVTTMNMTFKIYINGNVEWQSIQETNIYNGPNTSYPKNYGHSYSRQTLKGKWSIDNSILTLKGNGSCSICAIEDNDIVAHGSLSGKAPDIVLSLEDLTNYTRTLFRRSPRKHNTNYTAFF